jgi:transposase
MTDLFGVAGNRLLDTLELASAFDARVRSLRDLIAIYDTQVVAFERMLNHELAGHPGYRAIQAIHGVGRVFAALFVAEIGDVTRFPGPRQLCSWAGLTPKHHESDTVVRRGSITKQGSKMVRWAAVEAVTQARGTSKIQVDRHRLAERRGTGIAKVAAARKLLTLVYYGLRDGEIRCLTRPKAAA